MINKKELRNVFGNGKVKNSFLIKVHGYKRTFNQKASWRSPEEGKRGVLNVVKKENNWFNGVLIKNLSKHELEKYEEREKGYEIIEIEKSKIKPYKKSDEEKIEELESIYTTTGKK